MTDSAITQPTPLKGSLPSDVKTVRLITAPLATPHVIENTCTVQTTAITSPAPHVPGYEIVRELGRGGMGVVYQARHFGLNRDVALKVILSGSYSSEVDRLRFRQEAEAVARLRHPNIVAVYDIGDTSTHAYIAFELIEGGTLRSWRKSGSYTPREAAALIIPLARAVAHAHQNGVIHRDLKPSNILLREAVPDQLRSSHSGLIPHPGVQPLIADFGLAKQLDQGLSLTESGMLCGTPNYMAPEQVRNRTGDIGPAADIYSLGAILYELLSGQVPFGEMLPMEILTTLVKSGLPSIGTLCPHLPRDLIVIVDKCLEADPAQRYRTGDELANDLERFLMGRVIHARPTGLLERTRRWVVRNPMPTAIIALLALAMFLAKGALFLLWNALHSERLALAQAEQAKIETLAALELAHTQEMNAHEALLVAQEEKAKADLALREANRERGLARDAESRTAIALQSSQEKQLIADRHSKLTHEALTTVLDLLNNNERVNRSDLVPVQKEILYTLAPLYDKVLLLDQADHTYLKEKIQILEMISELEMETGNNKAAREAKRKIVNSIRELLKFQPNDQEMIQNVALALSRLGATHTKCHEHEEASQAHEDAMTLLQSLPADVKLTEHWLQISLDCHVNKSFSLSETNRPKEWIKHTEAGLQFAELVSEAYPQNMKIAYSLAILNYNMASVHIRSGEHEVAICYFLAASAAFEKSTQSANLRMAIHAKGRYADTLTKVGDLYQDLEIPELSDVYYSQVETILFEIVNSYPYNVDYWNSLARLLCHRGVLCTKRGHKASALQFYQRATAAAEKSIAGKNPHIRLRHDAFTCYRNLGFVCENTQNYLGALNAFTRARDLIPEMYQEYTFLQHAIIATNLTLLRFDQAIQEIKRLTHYVEGHEDAPLQIADAWLTYSGHVRRTEQADKVKVSIKYAEERALEALTIAKKNGLFGQKHRAESFRKSDLYDPIRDRFTIGD